MQEYENNKIVKTDKIDNGIIPEMGKESTHQVIGKFPTLNMGITINGLLFKVTRSDFMRGKLHLKIVKPG